MIDSNILEYSKLEPLNVSRETFPELEEFRSLILQKNKKINLISSNTEKISRERHIIDSAQMIDLIVFGPFAAAKFIPGARNVIYALPGVRTIGGMTSDLLSLSFLC